MEYLIRTVVACTLVSTMGASTTILAGDRSDKKATKTLNQLVKAMGGELAITNASSQQIMSKLQGFAPEQTFKPGDPELKVAKVNRILTKDLTQPRSHTEWKLDTSFPAISEFDYVEVINGEFAMVDGQDGLFAEPEQVPMLSSRMGARIKLNLLASPLSLVKVALSSPQNVLYLGKTQYKGRKQNIISISVHGFPVKLFVDVKNHLLSKIETMEDDTVYGDAKLEIIFKHWETVDNVKLPYQVKYRVNKRKIAIERRDAIHLNIALNDEMFTIPEAQQTPLNVDQFEWGMRLSAWFNRYLLVGVPFDIDQRGADTISFVEIANNVYHVLGATHHSLVIEMNEFLVVVEPVLYNDRSDNVIAAIEAKWPNKSIEYIVISHFHADHSAGVRSYAALGAKVIVGEETEAHFEMVVAAPHTLYPDTLALNPREVEIIGVESDEPYFITDGHRTIRIVDIPNRHSIGMLTPYIEDTKTLFTGDLYNPAAFPVPLPAEFSFWAFDLFDALAASDMDIEQIVGAHGGAVPFSQFISDVENSR